jgi:DNA-binding HxlR family transcriptional regulator
VDTSDEHGQELVADRRLRAAMDLFAHTWDPVVIAALRPGPRRRRELRAAIGGIIRGRASGLTGRRSAV